MTTIDWLENHWDHFPDPIKIVVIGGVSGIAGNYGTRITDQIIQSLYGNSISSEFQLLIILSGVLFLFDVIQKTRLNQMEQRIIQHLEEYVVQVDGGQLSVNTSYQGMIAGALVGAGFAVSVGPLTAPVIGILGASIGYLVERGFLASVSRNSQPVTTVNGSEPDHDSEQDPESRLSGTRGTSGPVDRARVLQNLGTVAQMQEDNYEAKDYFESSLAIFEDIGDRP